MAPRQGPCEICGWIAPLRKCERCRAKYCLGNRGCGAHEGSLCRDCPSDDQIKREALQAIAWAEDVLFDAFVSSSSAVLSVRAALDATRKAQGSPGAPRVLGHVDSSDLTKLALQGLVNAGALERPEFKPRLI